MAYVYPAKMRATRDLLRRRNHLMRKRAELYAHIQNTRSQYNLPETLGCIAKPQNRGGIVERFKDPSVQKMIDADFAVIEAYDPIIAKMEREIENINRFPTVQDFVSYCRLVKCSKESNGKKSGTGGKKIGNAHLKWAFSEAAALFLKCLVQDLFPGTRFEMKPESLSTSNKVRSQVVRKKTMFFR